MDRLQELVEQLTPWKSDVGNIESVNKPGDAELEPVYADLIELCDLYVGAGVEQQVTVRRMVAANRSVKKVLDAGWFLKNVSQEADYVKFLRLNLVAVSMTDGGFDFRSTLSRLKQWVQEARNREIDPAPHYREIANISSDQASFSAKGLITQALS